MALRSLEHMRMVECMSEKEKAVEALVELYRGIDDPDGMLLEALVQFLRGNRKPLIKMVEGK